MIDMIFLFNQFFIIIYININSMIKLLTNMSYIICKIPTNKLTYKYHISSFN